MPKSADAFRTISEVADWLETPAHVLRFWESKFSQVKPVKRAGGRRYYRPTDMQLLGGIKKLLHDDGMTIKGVQKVLREHGVKHVIALSQPLDEVTELEASEMAQDVAPTPEAADTGKVLNFQRDEGQSAGSEKKAEKPRTSRSTAKKAPAAKSDPVAKTAAKEDAAPAMPSFSHRPATDKDKATAKPTASSKSKTATTPPPPAPPAPVQINVPADPEDAVPADPSALSALAAHHGPVSGDFARQLGELADRLRASSSERPS